METKSLRISEDPQGTDADIYSLMNLFFPWHYTVGNLAIKPMPVIDEAPRPNLVFVGDSFMWQVAKQISTSRQCGEIATYFYYKVRKTTYVDGKTARLTERINKVDFGSEVFAADGLIFELNEGNIAPNNHRDAFVTEALDYITHNNRSERVPFLSERARPYWWGEKITFEENDPNLGAGFLYGFFDPQPPLIWTEGPEARIELASTPSDHDLILEAEMGAFIPKLGSQRITILANGERVGEWSIATPEKEKRRVMIPRQLVAKGNLTLRFQIAHPFNPKELDLSGDSPALGVFFCGLQISPSNGIAEQSALPDSFTPYQLGQEISFRAGSPNLVQAKYVSGFSGNESNGTWTDGSQAIIRLMVPPSDRDLVLEAYVGGFFPPNTTEQVAAVYVNGQRLGEWSTSVTAPAKRQLIIPRAVVGNSGKVFLQFQIAHPVSPFETGQGIDRRKLGLFFSQIEIHLAGSGH
jgi:hypothetical protein